jgi:hypothetical protein
MQTFLPYPDFAESACRLDSRRLGKQRVEAMQILRALRGQTRGWVNHPATRMWRGYEEALKTYYNAVLYEWCWRRYRNSMLFEAVRADVVMPPWLDREDFHASHRSNLLRKDPSFYSQFMWREPHDLPYVWPVPKE